MQTNARQLIFNHYAQYLACMSKATFFRLFRREFGLTPGLYKKQCGLG